MKTSTRGATCAPPPPGGDGRNEGGRPAGDGRTPPTAGSSLAHAPLRRLPAQHRSMVRVQRMLDACAELLDEAGYSALSTTRIAERAGVAIGSVYQFFPDKRAITQALGLRYVDLFTARVRERLAEGDREHWTQAADAIIDEYLAMHRTVPGFRSLHFGDVVDTRLLDSGADNNRVIATRVRQLLTSVGGAGESEELDRAVLVAVEAADAVLKLAFRSDAEGDPRLIEEAKLLVRNYLGHHFG
ncbi:transcriptional regulator BetI [Streptomonospora litoralis]|uniref:Transcriptional regulator BetI n=2 Tax=Streptomonospora litoralis TaxID=2498135 RepID=A0A4P6PV63_9ACTN|nr:transcriptional regulator BetI [Streptomonospora litoralis]